MFPYHINNNGDFENISHPHDQASSLKLFLNPNSKQEEPLSYFFDHNFPSPFFHYEEDNINFLLQHHDLLVNPQSSVAAAVAAAETVTNMADSIHSAAKQIPRSRRSSKRDRHSKINTAQGPRDRRMRLSLEVARNFFDLQDMLGYDKPSRTVEWLLSKSEAAIKEIARRFNGVAKSASSISDCEVVSGINEVAINQDLKRGHSKGKSSQQSVIKEKRIRQWRNAAFNPLARESREKARARARERTREKMLRRRLDESSQFDGSGNGDSNGLSSWSSFEVGEESAGTQFEIMAAKTEEPAATSTQKEEILGITQEMADDSFVIMDKFWSPSSIYNHLHNTGIPQEHQLQNFQFFWQTMGGLQQF